ncbi:hypothetical protein BC332_06429 [Capsicum chinense]|nr:hypothetical protein BC332_06429 [Capsicum chinense]
MIKKISQQAVTSQITNLSNIVISLTSTIICGVAFGVRFDEEAHERRRFDELIHETQQILSSFFVSDCFPSLSWIDKLTGMANRLEKNFKYLDEFYEELIEQHHNPNRPKSMEGDIIDLLLQWKKEQSTQTNFTLDNIKAILMNIFVAGTDTSAITVIWAMTALIKHPKVMKKVQAEIRESVGRKGIVNEDDTQNMPYLKAVIKETFRLYPAAPVLVAGKRDYGKFDTRRGQDFKLIPFGAGRRGCPGMALGAATVELILSNLLYAFDWELPIGMKIEDIDRDILRGITVHKKNDLCLVPKNYP